MPAPSAGMPNCFPAGRAGTSCSAIRKPTLTAEEQAFLDGPVNMVCAMIDDWDTRHNRADLPPEVWAYLKEQGLPRHAHRQGVWRPRLFGAGAEPGGEQDREPLGRGRHHRDGAQLARAGRTAREVWHAGAEGEISAAASPRARKCRALR